jgi:hypothetical protein
VAQADHLRDLLRPDHPHPGLVGRYLLSVSGLAQRRQLRLVALPVIGYAGLVGVALLPTTYGLAPVKVLDASTLGHLLAAAFLAASAVAAAVTAHARRASSPEGGP